VVSKQIDLEEKELMARIEAMRTGVALQPTTLPAPPPDGPGGFGAVAGLAAQDLRTNKSSCVRAPMTNGTILR
jgi:hypothetical protein